MANPRVPVLIGTYKKTIQVPEVDGSGNQTGNSISTVQEFKAVSLVTARVFDALGLTRASDTDLQGKEITDGVNGTFNTTLIGSLGDKKFTLVSSDAAQVVNIEGNVVDGVSNRQYSIPVPSGFPAHKFRDFVAALEQGNIVGFRTPRGQFYRVSGSEVQNPSS